MSLFEGLPLALRVLRYRARISQQELAERAGLRKNTVGFYERGATVPSLDCLERVLTVLGVDLLELHRTLYLVRGEDPPPMKPAADEPPLPPEVFDDARVAGVLAQFLQYRSLLAGLSIPRFGVGKKPP